MVFCVESFVGRVAGGEGVKLEEQVLITRDGAVPLSSYPYEEDLLQFWSFPRFFSILIRQNNHYPKWSSYKWNCTQAQ